MAKILCSPSKYVQGAGEMKKLGEYAQKYGKKALVLITESGYKRIGDVVNTGFEGYEITPVYEYFNRECSKNEINRLVDIMNEKGCDVVIGIGGGKILDTAKAVAYYKEVPVSHRQTHLAVHCQLFIQMMAYSKSTYSFRLTQIWF